MKAIITITGNQTEGYTVVLRLPLEWCKRFGTCLDCDVMGERVGAYWGGSNDDMDRIKQWHYRHVAAMEESVRRIREEIAEAKTLLAGVVQLDKSIEIEL